MDKGEIRQRLKAKMNEGDRVAVTMLTQIASRESEIDSYERRIRQQLESIQHESQSITRTLDSGLTLGDTGMVSRARKLDEFVTARYEQQKAVEIFYGLAGEFAGHEG